MLQLRRLWFRETSRRQVETIGARRLGAEVLQRVQEIWGGLGLNLVPLVTGHRSLGEVHGHTEPRGGGREGPG